MSVNTRFRCRIRSVLTRCMFRSICFHIHFRGSVFISIVPSFSNSVFIHEQIPKRCFRLLCLQSALIYFFRLTTIIFTEDHTAFCCRAGPRVSARLAFWEVAPLCYVGQTN